MATKLVMPRLSLTMETGSIIQWFKKEGETVEKGESVVEVLSDKVTYNVEAPASGVLRRVLAEEGSEVPVNSTLALIASPEEDLPEIPVSPQPPSLEPQEAAISKETEPARAPKALASPAARRVARELNVNVEDVRGTGLGGRIVEEDVKRFVEGAGLAPRIERVLPLAGIRKTTAERVTSSFRTAPHSFVIMDVDMAESAGTKQATQVSYTAILVHAAAKALREYSMVNSALVDGKIHLYEDVNIGVAVATERGLMVPVLRNADKRDLAEISAELGELAREARQGTISKEQMTGGTFTVTNLGMHDVNMFLPIINPPEAAILAAGKVIEKPMAQDGKIVIRPMMTLTLAYDHRIVDGAPAADFLGSIKKRIETVQGVKS